LIVLLVTFFIILLFFGLPLYITLFGMSAVLFTSSAQLPLVSAVISFQKLQSQEFISAIPLFTFAGYILAKSKSPDRIVNLFNNLFAFFRGADVAVVIIIMALFTALTGASGINILALGGLMLPLLLKNGKGESFSLGLITSSGSIGLLFAPSLPVIIYAIIASQNLSAGHTVDINTLFKSAFLPGVLLIVIMIVFANSLTGKNFVGKNSDYRHVDFSWGGLFSALKTARFELPLPFIVYGGIYSGFFTVMEAAVITAFYVFLIIFFLYKDIPLKNNFINITVESMKLSGGIFVIMATAFILTNYLVVIELPTRLFQAITPYISSKVMFLLTVNVFLLICGCLLDIFSAILIVLPILIPVVEKYGIDPYHFAIIFLINLEIGYLTPPVGMNLFIASYRFKKPITLLYKSATPFLFIMVMFLLLITYLPGLSTFLLDKPKPLSNAMDLSPPAMISDMSLLTSTDSSITVVFTAVGDDGKEGTAARYDLKIWDELITSEDDFDFSDERESGIVPKPAGSREIIHIKDLVPDTMYWVAIKAVDEAGNKSRFFKTLNVKTQIKKP